MDRAARTEPVGHGARDEGEGHHPMRDNPAELGLAEASLHVLVVEMEWVEVERGLRELADTLAGDLQSRAAYGLTWRNLIPNVVTGHHLSCLWLYRRRRSPP